MRTGKTNGGKPAEAARAAAAARNEPDEGRRLREVELLLFEQAELLDQKRWAEFIELFTADGVYWMPASPEQTTGEGVPAIFYEDRNLMTVRMKRITHPHAWSQAPLWGTSHVVGNIVIAGEDEASGELLVRSRFHMMEFRRDVTRHFAGSYRHHLRREGGRWRIRLQRVDMVNAQGAYDYVLQAWV